MENQINSVDSSSKPDFRSVLSSFVTIPSETGFDYWLENAFLISRETRKENMDSVEKHMNILKADTVFIRAYETLSPDEKSMVPILMAAQADLESIAQLEKGA